MRILIADDQVLVRDALRILLQAWGHEVVAEASSAREAVDLARRHRPHVALLSLGISVADTLAATRHLAAHLPSTRVVILADEEDDDILVEAIRSGAFGYLTKRLTAKDFAALLEKTTAGEPALEQGAACKLLTELARGSNRDRPPRSSTALTGREQQVLNCMVRGITSNRELAETLGITENTVRFHVHHVLEKLHLHSRTAAVAYALTHRPAGSNDGRPGGTNEVPRSATVGVSGGVSRAT